MKKNPQMPSARRILGMVVGIVIIGLGIALFKQSHLGNDSISALNMRLAEMLGISLGVEPVHEHPVLCTAVLVRAQVHRPGHLCQRHWRRVHCHGLLRPHCSPLWPGRGAGPAGAAAVGGAGGAGHGAGGFAVPDGRSGHRPVRLPLAGPAGLHPGAVLRLPRVHRCTVCAAVLAAGRPCGHRYADLCLLPGALHPVLQRAGVGRLLHYKPGGQ